MSRDKRLWVVNEGQIGRDGRVILSRDRGQGIMLVRDEGMIAGDNASRRYEGTKSSKT